MTVVYGPSIIRFTVHCMHAPCIVSKNALAYFDTIVSYTCKMFLTPGVEDSGV
jgi:hypothetical protein